MWRPSDPRFKKFKNDKIDEIKTQIMKILDEKKDSGDALNDRESKISHLKEILWEEEQNQKKRVERDRS